ncbi:C3a anaphylatoxin chemotactic receptor-like [Scleropages formosus]|nr:C3a anaphylatoxin chemotactic receptor-like [Scleropages formosus]
MENGTTEMMLEDYINYANLSYIDNDADFQSSPLWKVAVVLYCFTLVLGLPGNAFVLWIAGLKMKRTVNTTWFLNLAIADFLCCLSVPFSITDIILDYQWPYGNFLCKVIPTVVVLNMFASVFILTLISVDRFLQVIRPVWSQNHRTITLAFWLCVSSWVMAVALSLPSVIYKQAVFHDLLNKTVCTYNFSGSDHSPLISLLRFVFGFLIPIFIIILCYSFILHKVNSSHFSKSQKPLKIILGVIMAFFVCWSPYHIIGLVLGYGEEMSMSVSLALYIDPLSVSMAYFNSCLNPLLYVFMGQDFKEKVKLSLRRVLENAFSEAATHSGVHSQGEHSRATNTSEAQV